MSTAINASLHLHTLNLPVFLSILLKKQNYSFLVLFAAERSKYLPFNTDGYNPDVLREGILPRKICMNAFCLCNIFVCSLVQNPFGVLSHV